MKRTSWVGALLAAMLLLLAACGAGDTQKREVTIVPLDSAQTEDEASSTEKTAELETSELETPEPESNEPSAETSVPIEAEPAEAQPEAVEPEPQGNLETEPEAASEAGPAQPITSDAETPDENATREAGNDAPGGNGDASNFNTYDNKSQQNTDDKYVLNTNTKKIHNPWCSSVPKISPKNYATTNKSVEELEAEGYTKCGQKGDWK